MHRLLQWNDRHFQSFFADAPVGLAVSKIEDDRLVLCNNRLGQIFGIDPAELIGKPASSFYVNPNDRLLLLRDFQEHGFVERKQCEVQGPDDKRFWMQISCRAIELNGEPAVFSCIDDVTQHRLTQRALEASEARFRAYFEYSPVPFCVWRMHGDSDFLLEACNSAALEISKGPFPKKVGIKASEYFKKRPDVLQLFQQCVKVRGRFEKELEFRFGKSGEDQIFSVYFMFVAPDTVMVHALDRTHQRRTEQELEQKRAELSHKYRLATVGKMSSVLAHEINQPLGAIANFSTTAKALLSEPEIDMPRLRELLSDVADEALRAGEITRSLKRFAGQAVPHRSTIDINDAVVEVTRLMAADARRQRTKILLNLFSEPLLVNADFVQIQQVLVNVILNALEAIEQSPKECPAIDAETAKSDEFVIVRISDNGCGIEKKQTEAIFDPYFTTKATGVGLGLSIARELVESHGGRLWATPNKESGLVIQMQLPAAGEAPT